MARKGTAPSPMHHTSASPLSLPSGAPSAAAEEGVALAQVQNQVSVCQKRMTCLPCKSRRLENGVTSVGGPHLSPWLEPANGTLQAQLRGTEALGNTGRFEGNFWCLTAPPAIQLEAAFLHTEGATPCPSCVRTAGEAPIKGMHPQTLNLSPQRSHTFSWDFIVSVTAFKEAGNIWKMRKQHCLEFQVKTI